MRISLFLFILISLSTLSGCISDSSSDNNTTSSDPDTGTDGDPDTDPDTDTDTDTQIPNILLIIADDQGLDASAQYSLSTDLPYTPTLDKLAQEGIIFDNAWATPSCTTTRGALISGMHGINSGVDTVPNTMSTDTNTIQRALANDSTTESIANAVFGKWHIAGTTPDLDHPQKSGVNHYYGNIKGNLTDYELWDTTKNGVEGTSSTYHTTDITDKAIDWISLQNSPWFAWVAYSAPHSPFHLPPEELHSRNLSGTEDDIANNRRDYFLTAIEAMDTEIGRLLESLDDVTRENTLIIYLGDNGTPSRVVDTSAFMTTQVKNTLYEGGIHVPMVVSGAKVLRSGTRESALVNAVDIFPTILNATGADIPTNIDGQSFYELLSDATASNREFNYSEFVSNDVTGWAVSNGSYKLIVEENGDKQLFYINDNLLEDDNLIDSGSTEYEGIISELTEYGSLVRERNSTD